MGSPRSRAASANTRAAWLVCAGVKVHPFGLADDAKAHPGWQGAGLVHLDAEGLCRVVARVDLVAVDREQPDGTVMPPVAWATSVVAGIRVPTPGGAARRGRDDMRRHAAVPFA